MSKEDKFTEKSNATSQIVSALMNKSLFKTVLAYNQQSIRINNLKVDINRAIIYNTLQKY